MISKTFLLAIAFGVAATFAAAQEMREVELRFAPGASGAEVSDTITGYESVLYRVGAEAGQTMRVTLSSSNLATYFNVYAPGRGPGDEALAIGEFSDPINDWTGVLPVSGEYLVSVFMMRAAARRDERSEYLLGVSVGDADAAGAEDGGAERVRFAAGTSGAELTGVLQPGGSRRYLIGAQAEQDLYVRVAPQGQAMSFQIFNPDGSFLLEQVSSDLEYRGQLWQSGDHVIEVINRTSASAPYSVIIGID